MTKWDLFPLGMQENPTWNARKSIKEIYYVNKIEQKNHTIISITVEKHLTLLKFHSYLKTLSTLGIKRDAPILIKNINNKSIADFILNGEFEYISSQMENKFRIKWKK